MSKIHKIAWTNRTKNFAAGCEEARYEDGKMSPECANCYAKILSARLEAMGQKLYKGIATRKGNHARNTVRRFLRMQNEQPQNEN